MSIGVSIFLLIVGAVLTFAVEVQTEGIDLDAIGVILMLGGLLGLIVSVYLSRRATRRRRTVVDGDRVVEERRVERDQPPERDRPPEPPLR